MEVMWKMATIRNKKYPIVGKIEWEGKIRHVWILVGKNEEGKDVAELKAFKDVQFE